MSQRQHDSTNDSMDGHMSVDNGVTGTPQVGTAPGRPALSTALGRLWIDGTDGGTGKGVLYVAPANRD